jgi:hypothetical protein
LVPHTWGAAKRPLATDRKPSMQGTYGGEGGSELPTVLPGERAEPT